MGNEKYIVKIIAIDKVTHDSLKIVTKKPKQYVFTLGQATEIFINKKDWENKKRFFTFTCLPEDDYLEFTIKTYPDHKGVTNELLRTVKNDELIFLHVTCDATYYSNLNYTPIM